MTDLNDLTQKLAQVVSRYAVRKAVAFLEGKRLELVVDLMPEKGIFELAGLWDELRQEFPQFDVYVWTFRQRSPIGGVLIYDAELKPVS